MVIKKWLGKVKLRRVIIMAVMTKPSNSVFMVRDDKVKEFMSRKRDDKALAEIKRRANLLKKNFIKGV
jgi:hypothetical protein